MTLASLKAWIRKPTNIIGLSTAAGTIAHLAGQAATGQTNWATAAGGMAFSIICIVIPDNTGEQNSIEKLVQDAIQAAATQHIQASIPLLTQDVMGAVAGLIPAPVVVGAPTPGPAPVVPLAAAPVIAPAAIQPAAATAA
jgi:hypothetical protein